MICNLCRGTATLRRDGTYASHGTYGDNTDKFAVQHCRATGLNPDEALSMRRTFNDKGHSPSELRLADDGNGATIRAFSVHHSSESRIWVGLVPDDMRRLAAELTELADTIEARGN